MTNEYNPQVYVCARCGGKSYDAVRHLMKECPKANQAIINTRLTLLEQTGTSRPRLSDLEKNSE